MYDPQSKRDGVFLTSKDDPRIPVGIRIRAMKNGSVSYKRWFLPLRWGHLTLRQAYQFLTTVGAPQGKIPEIIRWTEGKDSKLVKQFFYGGVDLRAHDYIHILLGRGLLPKDEAFVIGFTMGSTNRLESMNEDAFAYIAKHHYPNAYRMDDDSKSIFLDASKLGFISDCVPLDQVDFAPLLDMSIDEIRRLLNLKTELLDTYYRDIEQKRFPNDPASRRLVIEPSCPRDPWTLKDDDALITMTEAVQKIDTILDSSDQLFDLEATTFHELLNQTYHLSLEHIGKQRDIVQICFEEINRLLNHEDPLAKENVETRRWDAFHEIAKDNIIASRDMVQREVNHAAWEGYTNEDRELRTWVHAILGRGDSPRDRAFCRGFFHGTSNQRTSYASQLKLDIMRKTPISRDGLYSQDMIEVYKDAVKLGHISDCMNLDEIEFETLAGRSIRDARKQLNLNISLIEAYRDNIENQRLLL